MLISCRKMTALMTDQMEGRLSWWNRWKAALHLKICSGCCCYRDQLRTTAATLGELPVDEPPPDVRERLLAELDRRHGR